MYLGIAIFLLNTFLGLLTVYKKRTLESIVFSIFACSFGLWAFSIYYTITTSSLFWGRTCFFSAIIGIGSIFLFSKIFPNNQSISRRTFFLIITPPLFFGLASYTNVMLSNVAIVNGSIIGTFGPLMSLYQVFAPIYIFGSIYIIFKKYKKSNSYDKNKIGYALLGISLFIGPAVLTNAVLPLWFNINHLNSFGPLFSIFMVTGITYAIIKHQFLDIKIIIQRGLIYTILLSLVIITYLSLVFTFEYLLHKSNSISILVSAFFTTVIGIFGVPPLKTYFQKITDPYFFKHAYNYASVLRELTEELNKNITLKSITENTSTIIKKNLKPEFIEFNFEPNNTEERISVITIPIVSNQKNIGTLSLGEKLSGDPYTKEDMLLLETFTKQSAIALEKATLYDEVKEYAENLEIKVEQRTKEIRTIQKDQESMMLEISHGLQTPLTIMKGELFFLRKQGYDTSKVDTIDSSIDRISSFIYRLLSLSRLETTKNISNNDIDVNLLTTQVIASFNREVEEKSIVINFIQQSGTMINGNKEEIEELISNLISNSIKYSSPKRKQVITITVSSDTHNAKLVLQDTGIGIQKDNIQNLFKKFYRIKDTETKGIPGTGLGLAICKTIVEKHSGTIIVESEFDVWTRFTILLPLTK